MKNSMTILILSLLFLNCTHAIEPISNVPIPKAKAPLSVLTVSPSWIKWRIKESVVIYGLGFEPGAKAFIGERECVNQILKDTTRIWCELPEQDFPGDYSVTVKNPDGTINPIARTSEEMELIRKLNEQDGYEDGVTEDGLLYLYYVKSYVRSDL